MSLFLDVLLVVNIALLGYGVWMTVRLNRFWKRDRYEMGRMLALIESDLFALTVGKLVLAGLDEPDVALAMVRQLVAQHYGDPGQSTVH